MAVVDHGLPRGREQGAGIRFGTTVSRAGWRERNKVDLRGEFGLLR